MREHPRLFAGLFLGSIIGLIAITCLGGCMSTPDPLNPTKKITPQQLSQEAVGQQEKFDNQATTLQAQRQSILDDYQQQADALKNKFQQASSKLTSDTAAYNTAVAAYNQKLSAASADLKDQADRNAKLVELGGNIVNAAGTGTFGPAAALGATILTGLAGGLVGTWRDSAAKSSTITVQRQQIAQLTTQTNPPAAGPGGTPISTDTGPGAAPLVQGVAPAGIVLKPAA